MNLTNVCRHLFDEHSFEFSEESKNLRIRIQITYSEFRAITGLHYLQPEQNSNTDVQTYATIYLTDEPAFVIILSETNDYYRTLILNLEDERFRHNKYFKWWKRLYVVWAQRYQESFLFQNVIPLLRREDLFWLAQLDENGNDVIENDVEVIAENDGDNNDIL